MKTRAIYIAAAIIGSPAFTSSTYAVTFTWDGGGPGVNWNTAGNWDGAAPTSNVATDLIFAGVTNVGTSGTPLNQNVAAPMLFNSITFGATAGNFFLGGSGFVITGGDTSTITQSSANNQSIANSIAHTGGNNTTGALVLSGDGGGVVTLSGAINNGNGNRFLSITKSGTSTFVLTNATSSYTGATTIQAGKLIAGANGALGTASSAIVLGNGSTSATDAPSLLINGAFTVARAITVGSVANTAAYNATIGGSNTTGTSTFSGNITLNNTAANYTTTLQAATGGTVEFITGTWTTNNRAIAIGSSGNTGTVKLSNTLSTTGGVSVNFGTFLLGASNRLGDTTPVTVAGGIFDTGTALTDTVSVFNMSSGSLNGTGTITAATYGLSGGTVTGNLGAGTMNVTVGTVTLNGTADAASVNVNSGTLAIGANNRLANSAAISVAGGTLDIGGFNDSVGAVTLSSGSIAGSGGGTLTGTSYAVESGSVSAILGGSGSLTKSTSGTVTLSGANTYSGSTTINGGILSLASTGSIDNSSGVVLNNGNFNVSAITGGYAITSLAGNGSVTGDLTVSGALGIGASPGTITFNDDLTLGGSSVSNFEINLAFAGYDLADSGVGSQTVNFGGTLNLLFASGFNTLGSVKIFDFEGYSGNFTSVLPTGLASGFTATFDQTTGIVTVVPEPKAAFLGSLGALALLRRRRD